MNQENFAFIMMFFSRLLLSLPSLIVCGIACFMLTTRKSTIAGAPHLALWGFGLAIVGSTILPLLYTLVDLFVRAGGAQWLGIVMFGLTVVGILLHMSVYILLLMALLNPNPHRHSAAEQQGDPK
jgi:uncharacterized PurR-regulated membrane protein YhhQ (DUF165 family)